jgi:hypothetical protein
MSPAGGGHQRIDWRSLAAHRAIAGRLRGHSELLAIARENRDRWSRQNGRSQPYWDRWRELLDVPLEDLLQLLVEDSEAMTALRQATPFAGVLSPAQRWAVYAEFAAGRPGTP